MIASSVCLLTATLVVVAAMPPPSAEEMTESMALCHSALITTPMGPDMPIMTTCCSTKTQLSEGQCQAVLQAMSKGKAEMKKKKMGGGMMHHKEAMHMESGMPESEPEPESEAEPESEPEPENSAAGEEGMESVEDGYGEYTTMSAMEGEEEGDMFTMEMMAAEPIIMECLMKTTGLLSADGVVNEVAVRYVWNKRVLPTAGEELKTKLVAAIDTCPASSKQELMMFPVCLVKTCSAADQ